ncbi:MAG: sulfite exporter TauE/SafE family protein [Candidatus Heimdallarchaeota archaeon]
MISNGPNRKPIWTVRIFDSFTLLFLISCIFLIAAVAAIIGLGGGVFYVPLFLYVGGLSMKEAAPLSLFIILGVSSISTLTHYRERQIKPKTGLLLEVFTIIGAVGGTFVNTFLSEVVLRLCFAVVLFLIGGWTFLEVARVGERSPSKDQKGSIGTLSSGRKLVIFTLSFLIGLITGSLGIGGGVVKVPILVYVVGIPMPVAVGTSELMIVLTSLVSGLTYHLRGRLEVISAIPFILAGMAGAYLSTRISMKRLGSKQLSTIFASFVILVGLFMLLETYLALNLNGNG